MTMNLQEGLRPTRNVVALGERPAFLPWLALAGLFMAAIALRHVVAANTDVSWLLIAAERLLDGQALYREIIETNPPMAVLVYVPGVLIGRWLGLPAESVVDGLMFSAIAVSIGLAARILENSSAIERAQRWPFALLAFAILTIMPAQAFAQREHIAVVELLPALAVLVLRVRRENPQVWAIVVAGLGLGLALSFKPHFAIAMLCWLSILALWSRSWRLFIVPENFIAAAVVVAYVGIVLAFFPDYFTVIGPMARDIYIPFSLSAGAMLLNPVMLPWAIAVIGTAVSMRRRGFDPAVVVLLAVSFAFAVIFILQRKGWAYQSYPMTVFALLALGLTIGTVANRAGRDRIMDAGAAVLLVALFVKSIVWFNYSFDARELEPSVARLGPHPTILAITGQAGLGHPLTRSLGGTWVSRQQMLLVADYYAHLRKQGPVEQSTAAMMDRYAARERQWLIEDFHKTPPTVVLVDNFTGNWGDWLKADPELVGLMKDYRLRETFMGIDIYGRRTD